MKQHCLLALCLMLVGCNCPQISNTIAEQVSAANAVDFHTFVPGNWDRFCVLGPYSTGETARDTLGFSWPIGSRSSVKSNDGISLLLFVREQQVVHSVDHPRNKGDFAKLSGRCFTSEQAQFVLKAGRTDNWPELVPRNGV